jgi:hypothetical protein
MYDITIPNKATALLHQVAIASSPMTNHSVPVPSSW